ncbi:MAG: hypothetical protein ACLGI6_22435 [Gammaproteobacteria bacterium]
MHLGDLGFTVPLAAAIAAALLAAGAHRFALTWSAAFCLAMLAVGVNKIGFMTWGVGVSGVSFRAASGHAAGASAIFPLLFYLCGQLVRQRVGPAPLQQTGARARESQPAGPPSCHAELAAGVGVGAVVAAILVLCNEHSPAEALAGCAIGAGASLFCIVRAQPVRLAPAHLRASALCFVLTFVAAAWLMQFLPIAGWMIAAARLLAGVHDLHALAPG